MHYTLTLDERTVQFLVDQLRHLPHHQVDAALQAIRAQCEAQDRAQAEALRSTLRAEIEAELAAAHLPGSPDDAQPALA